MKLPLGVRAKLTAEKVKESKATEKVVSVAKTSAHVATETAGFLAWSLGRLFRPIVKRVRRSYANYRTELNPEE